MWLAIAVKLTLTLAVKATPAVSLAPATVVIQTIVPRDVHNRYKAVIWGDQYGELGRAEQSIDGDDPVVAEFTLQDLGDGDYIVYLVVTKDDGRQQRARTEFSVKGGGR